MALTGTQAYAILKAKINGIVEELGKVGFRGPYEDIESLPTPGVEGYIYLVEKEDQEDYYDEYYWNEDLEEYQSMGSTKIPDLLWLGTAAEWSELSNSQKEEYINGLVCISDDVANSRTIVDVIEDGNMNAATSNAVFDAIEGTKRWNRIAYVSTIDAPGSSYYIEKEVTNLVPNSYTEFLLVFGHAHSEDKSKLTGGSGNWQYFSRNLLNDIFYNNRSVYVYPNDPAEATQWAIFPYGRFEWYANNKMFISANGGVNSGGTSSNITCILYGR